jgi:broad specificity phosphatase PhoE
MGVQVALIRPGATLYDEQQRLQGSLDLPLTARGERESLALAESLGSIGLSALYHGPGESLSRTAEEIARVAGLRPRLLDELRNLDQGLWQGLQLEEIKRRNPKLFRQWLEEPQTICPPQGETIIDALVRVKTGLKPLWKKHKDQLIGLVVGEPLAQIVASYLRGRERPQLDENLRTGCFERIEVAPAVERNGFAFRTAAQ